MTTTTTTTDPFVEFKRKQRDGWAHFAPVEIHTIPVAGNLVRFAGITPGERVLDVGTGTGVVAITAARAGAKVTGLDLTPELLVRAREHAALAAVDVEWHEGDAEALPFADRAFDVVLSQFGHMFAPRPDIALAEMLRVLRPGGRIAFATWPPELFTAGMFALVASHLPPPAGAASPALWGDPGVVRARLGERCADLHFDRGILRFATLSPQHYRAMAEPTVGPVRTLVQAADANERQRFRSALEELAARYLQDNEVLAGYLLTRARLRS